MDGARPQQVNLREPIRVFIVYGTAVANEQGVLYLLPDIYGHDATLAELLRASRKATNGGERGRRARKSAVPAAHATGIKMGEVGRGVVAAAAALQAQAPHRRGGACSRHPGARRSLCRPCAGCEPPRRS